MSTWTLTTTTAAALCLALATSAGASDPAQPLAEGERAPDKGVSDCAKVRTSAHYGAYGYDHIVEIENTCDETVICSVVTNVNTKASEVTVAPKQKKSVTTFRGSPAREFEADVSCKEAS